MREFRVNERSYWWINKVRTEYWVEQLYKGFFGSRWNSTSGQLYLEKETAEEEKSFYESGGKVIHWEGGWL